MSPGRAFVAFHVARIAAALADDLAAFQEHVGNADRLVEQAAGVVAQVEDQPLHLGVLRLDLGEGGLGLVGGLLVEAGDAQDAVVAVEAGDRGLRLDHLAHDLHVEGIGFLAGDGQGHRLAGLAAHLLDRVVDRQAQHALAVHGGDVVAGLHAGGEGGRAVHRRDHLDHAVLAGDLDAQAAVFAARLVAHVVEVLGVEVAGVRIERGQHAVEGGVDQLGVVDRRHILALDGVQHVAEQAEHPIGLGSGGRRGHGVLADIGHGPCAEHEGRNADQEVLLHHPAQAPLRRQPLMKQAPNERSRAQPAFVFSQRPGSTGTPCSRTSR